MVQGDRALIACVLLDMSTLVYALQSTVEGHHVRCSQLVCVICHLQVRMVKHDENER